MTDELLPYFEEELSQIRRAAREFGKKYQAAASHLHLDSTRGQDPHVERLIESFAYIAGRIHRRLDSDYPELTDALLSLLYPESLMPMPSCCIAQIDGDPQRLRTKEGLKIERHSQLRTRSVNDIQCRFRTVYPVQLWPVQVERVAMRGVNESELAVVPQQVHAAHPDLRSSLVIAIKTIGSEPMAEYSIDSLRFHLTEDAEIAHELYDKLLRRPVGLIVKSGSKSKFLSADAIRPVGFGLADGLLTSSVTGLTGYRLLNEYFVQPEKFLFVDFEGIGTAFREVVGKTESTFEIVVLLEDVSPALERRLRPGHLRLGCTPIVNVFEHEASPIRMDVRRVDYRVDADDRFPQHYEVLAVNRVHATVQGEKEGREFRPFFSLRHGDGRESDAAYYHTRRSLSDDGGTELAIMLVDPQMRAATLANFEVMHVSTTCSNRDLPSRLSYGDIAGDFQLEGKAEIRHIVALGRPSKVLRPHLKSESRWRLVSHLGVNYLSLAGGTGNPVDSLREVLGLYDFANNQDTRGRIAGLVGVDAGRVTRVLPGIGPVRGVRVVLTLDEKRFVGSSAFLFASVLEAFLALYVTINSFVVVEARFVDSKEPFKIWSPRTGEKQVI